MDNYAASDSDLKVFFAKSRSPNHRATEELDGLTEDLLLPLVAGDEFEEQEFEGNTNLGVNTSQKLIVSVSCSILVILDQLS